MKQCPTCNSVYSDDTQLFCLEDGTPLVATYDPDETRVNPRPHIHADEVAAKPSNPLLYVIIALLALLVGGGLVALLKSDMRGAPASNESSPDRQSLATPGQTQPAAAPTTETNTHRVEVPANQMWTDTGIILAPGQTVRLQAFGEVNASSRHTNVNRWVGPNGWTQLPGISSSSKASWVLGRTSYMCLTGKIGANGKPFKVGSNYFMQTNSSGPLFLGINDEVIDESGNLVSDGGLAWQDNAGSFNVQITITK
jgi:hypothetical protein